MSRPKIDCRVQANPKMGRCRLDSAVPCNDSAFGNLGESSGESKMPNFFLSPHDIYNMAMVGIYERLPHTVLEFSPLTNIVECAHTPK